MSQGKLIHTSNEPATKQGKFLTHFQRKLLQKNMEENLPESYRQRIQIMLMADEGKSQTEICRILGCCSATARHWMHIARSGMAHQWQECPIGRPKVVNDLYLTRLEELLANSPRDYGYSFRRWTVNWLSKHLAKEFGVELSDRHIKRLLKKMGLSTKGQLKTQVQMANGNDRNAKIFISDIKPESNSDNFSFLPTTFATLGKDLDSHGAESVKSATISAPVPVNSGISAFGDRVSTLPL